MAIGDAVSIELGTAQTDRQPSSGVEEQIMMIRKSGTTDAVGTFDGSTQRTLMNGTTQTVQDQTDATQRFGGDFNMAWMITNSNYLRKVGTTDQIGFYGVQTNA